MQEAIEKSLKVKSKNNNFFDESISGQVDTLLINHDVGLTKDESQQTLFQQYKLLIESLAHVDERSASTSNIFIAVNSIFATILTQVIPNADLKLENRVLLVFFLIVGVVICLDWLDSLRLYKKIGYVNYVLIKTLEKKLPTFTFSLRADIIGAGFPKTEKSSVILKREIIIPCLFLILYVIFLGFMLFKISNILTN